MSEQEQQQERLVSADGYTALVRKARNRDRIIRDAMIQSDHDNPPEAAMIGYRYVYQCCVACSIVTAPEGVELDMVDAGMGRSVMTWEQYLELPDQFTDAWAAAVVEINAHWFGSSAAKEAEKKG